MNRTQLEKELIERQSDEQYGTIVKSPTNIIHILENDETTTLCGIEFGFNNNWELNKDWILYEDSFFHEITCERCIALETKRMELEIEEEAKMNNHVHANIDYNIEWGGCKTSKEIEEVITMMNKIRTKAKEAKPGDIISQTVYSREMAIVILNGINKIEPDSIAMFVKKVVLLPFLPETIDGNSGVLFEYVLLIARNKEDLDNYVEKNNGYIDKYRIVE